MTTFPSGIVSKPSNISDGLAILASHVGTLWDETVQMQGELLGGGSGSFIMDIRPTSAGNTVIRTRQSSGDSVDRFNFNANGKMFWGTGGAASDVQLERSTTRFLKVTGAFDIRTQNAADIGLNLYGAASQSASFLKVLDSTGVTAYLELTSGGQLKVPTTGSSAGVLIGGDVQLYRSGAAALTTTATSVTVPGNLVMSAGTSLISQRVASGTATVIHASAVSGDTNDRFQIAADGTHNWGPGNTATDTSISRTGVNTLTTAAGLNMGSSQVNGNLVVTGNLTVSGSTSSTPSSDVAVGAAFSFSGLAGSATSTVKLKTSVTTDTNNRFQITADGAHAWGPGNSSTDTSLSRTGVNALTTTASLTVGALTTSSFTNSGTYGDVSLGAGNTFIGYASTATSTLKLKTRVTTDTVDRFSIAADGTQSWGTGGAAVDTTLARSGVNALTTTAALAVGSLASTGAISATNVNASGTVTAAGLSFTGDLSLAAGNALKSLASSLTTTPKIQFQVAADTGLRYQVLADGTTSFGNGTALGQNIAYLDANGLKTSGTWQVGTNLNLVGSTSQVNILTAAASSTATYRTSVSGDTNTRFALAADGTHNWSSGFASVDATLARTAVNTLTVGPSGSGILVAQVHSVQLGGNFQGLLSSAATTNKLTLSVAGDTNPRFNILADGTHQWGPGNAAVDTFITRNAIGDILFDRTGTAKTRLALRRPDGTIRWISVDNNDQLLLETS